eukprot:4025092-Pyramimonas_sp.AAC.1
MRSVTTVLESSPLLVLCWEVVHPLDHVVVGEERLSAMSETGSDWQRPLQSISLFRLSTCRSQSPIRTAHIATPSWMST